MHLDIAALAAPLSAEAPSGPDLSYDSERTAIEAAFERTISVDNDGSGGADTDWRTVIAQITAQAERTRDIWLPVYLMRAAVFARQFDLLVEAAGLLAALIEERWTDVHPQLDEYGFIGRKTPCESLTRVGDFIGPLFQVPLLEHPRFGRFVAEDLERFAEKGGGADGFGPFRATLEATSPEDIQVLVDRFEALYTAIRRVDAALTAHAEGDTATNFRPTYQALDRIRAAFAKLLPGQAAANAPVAETGSPSGDPEEAASYTGVAAPAGPGFQGAIRNREDVVRALDAICAYYAAHEPGSPVPLVLRRARAWTGLDFLAVLEDIAPGGMEEAGRVLKSGRSVDGEGWTGDGGSDGSSGKWGEDEPASSGSTW